MTVGNLVALRQRNLKRLLAYSSISQVGYVLVGLAALNAQTASAVLVHLAGYAFTNLAAFVAVIAYYNSSGREEIPDYAGLADRAPFLALSLTIALFSLAGMPLFAGFATKFFLFTTAANGGLLLLVGIAVVNSFVSLYYYLLVIKQMYLYEPAEPARLRPPPVIVSVLVVLLVGVFLMGLYPAPVVDLAAAAVRGLFA
jgi:NADH-quinone oxidoreductase subunit N